MRRKRRRIEMQEGKKIRRKVTITKLANWNAMQVGDGHYRVIVSRGLEELYHDSATDFESAKLRAKRFMAGKRP